MDWVNVILQGILVGGLYAMFAAGLSLIFGVMRLVNIAHGDLIVLAAYVALVTTHALGVGPLTSLIIVVPVMALIGYLLQWLVLNRTLGDDLLPPLLVTFGLSVIIQNGLLTVFTADSVKLQAGEIEVATLRLAEGLYVGVLPLLQLAVAVAVIGALQFIFYRTALGRAFRATADDPEVAQLMGLDNRQVFALAMALSLAVVAIAGVFLAVRANFDPSQGPARLIFGFEAVIIGGLGSLWGTLAGGLILGVAQAIGAHLDPGWQILAGHLAFLIVLAVRPQGLFPEGADMSDGKTPARRLRQPGEPYRARAVRARRDRARRRAVVGRPRRPAAAVGNLRLCGAGEPVEFARRLCRPRLGRPAGLCRARRLSAVCASSISAGCRRSGRSRSPASSPAWWRSRSPRCVFRLRGHYFAIGTWIIAEVFRLLASQVSALGGGSGTSLPAGHRRSPSPRRGRCANSSITGSALGLMVAILAADRAAAALALWAGAQGDPRQRARRPQQRRRRHPHQIAGLYRDRARHRHGRRADLPAEAPDLAGCRLSASTTGPPS